MVGYRARTDIAEMADTARMLAVDELENPLFPFFHPSGIPEEWPWRGKEKAAP